MAFHVGQKVVCINKLSADDYVLRDIVPLVMPIKGAVYTINWMSVRHAALYLGFEEIDPRTCADATNFRPVRTTDAGMSILNRLLLPKPKKARVRA